MPGSERRARLLDLLAGGAALLGGSMLLSARRPAAGGGTATGDAQLDPTARQGRGRAVAPPSPLAVRSGHETRDTDAAFIGRALVGLGVVATLAVCGVLLLLALFHRQLQADRPAYTAEQSALLDPPRPQLEAHPETDMQRQREGDRARLDGYGWVDATHATARIPVARAMQLVVGRSLDAAP